MHRDISSRRGHREITELDRTACRELLRQNSFGRVVVVTPEGALVIRPVNYVYDVPSQSIVFRTSPGSKLHALLTARTASFEVDSADLETGTGWSVIASGSVEPVNDQAELERLTINEDHSWTPGEHHPIMRIRAFTVSGRRVAVEIGGHATEVEAPGGPD
jgi:uncharacterized protein